MNYLTKAIFSVGLLLIYSGSSFTGEILYANHCYGIKGPLNYHSESYIFSWVKSLGNSEYIFFDRVVKRLYKMSGSKISFIENIEDRYSINLSYGSLNPPFYEEDISRMIEKGEGRLLVIDKNGQGLNISQGDFKKIRIPVPSMESIIWSGEDFVAFSKWESTQGKVFISKDGVDWSPVNIPEEASGFRYYGVDGGGLFVVFEGLDGLYYLQKDEFIKYSDVPYLKSRNALDVVEDSDLRVSRRILVSPKSGKTLEDDLNLSYLVPDNDALDQIYSFAKGNVAISNCGRIYFSNDGSYWSQVLSEEIIFSKDMSYSDDGLVIVGTRLIRDKVKGGYEEVGFMLVFGNKEVIFYGNLSGEGTQNFRILDTSFMK